MRKYDFDIRLHHAVRASKRAPFMWGGHDCCKAAARIVTATTGKDIMKGSRRYRSAFGAMKLLRKQGFIKLSHAIKAKANAAGFKQQPSKRARFGDLVTLRWQPQDEDIDAGFFDVAVGVCVGAKSIFATTSGWMHVPTLKCKTSFRVE